MLCCTRHCRLQRPTHFNDRQHQQFRTWPPPVVKYICAAEGEGKDEGLHEGDTLVTNHPVAAGGSHLPDITVVTPVFQDGEIIFFVASRGHHADVGGISPGSMPPNSQRLVEEGAMIVTFKLVKQGQFQVCFAESSWCLSGQVYF